MINRLVFDDHSRKGEFMMPCKMKSTKETGCWENGLRGITSQRSRLRVSTTATTWKATTRRLWIRNCGTLCRRSSKSGRRGSARQDPHLGSARIRSMEKIICGRCGGLMSRNTHTGYNGEKHKVWICKDRLKGRRGNGCRGRIVREDEVLEVMNTGSTADNLQNTVIKILDDGIEVCAEM